MNIKNVVKEYSPKWMIQPLRKIYRKIIASSIIARAEKLRPYYRDELSKSILSDREYFLRTTDEEIFIERAVKEGWKFPLSLNHSHILIIHDKNNGEFRRTTKFLKVSGYADKYRVLMLDEFIRDAVINKDELIIPVLSKKNRDKFFRFMYEKNIFFTNNIYNCLFMLAARTDIQYFDVFEPADDEIIVDAGAFDGGTARQFLQWGGSKIKKIYSFEFDPVNAAKCEENLKDLRDKVVVVKKGTWDKDEKLYINTSGTTETSVRSKGNEEVYLTTIDSIVKDERVTFIKMDVEGAELKSLIGARNTIIRNKPRLAISVYHKPEDIVEIPEYILSLVPEYRFYLRHYCSICLETILYASCA